MIRGAGRNGFGLWAFVLIASATVGCGGGRKPWERVYPAKGQITYKGKSLAGAMITFIPVDPEIPATVRPSATSKDDGTFELGTYSKTDGAPVGEYKVTVLHFAPVGPKENPSPGPNKLPAKYAKPDTTDLKISFAGDKAELSPLDLK